ncbi:MAG: TIGR03862 family flavoprotein [Planctomycetota bacterium]|nr:MAG: TIGR03862 family flavoprotein [Planctomycetota bacterium]
MSENSPAETTTQTDVVVIGAGPAGLAAAEVASAAGRKVVVLEAGPRAGRKFLLAGKSGLNLTCSADVEGVLVQLGSAAAPLAAALRACPPAAIRAWAAELDTPTYVGTSGKVFPVEQRANGLLERWLARCQAQGVELRCQQPVQGLRRAEDGRWWVDAPQPLLARAVVLAMGGASWPQTGSDGAWCRWLGAMGLEMVPWASANCGVNCAFDDVLRRHAGSALKNLQVQVGECHSQGEAVITDYGLEGMAIYPLIPQLRQALAEGRPALLQLNLQRDRDPAAIVAALQRGRSGDSFSKRLRSRLGLSPAAVALIHWAGGRELADRPEALAALCRRLPVPVQSLRPLDEAISVAGGLGWSALDADFQLRSQPGCYAIGEMVDWEAPTGGYLLSVCLAMGRYVGQHLARIGTGAA